MSSALQSKVNPSQPVAASAAKEPLKLRHTFVAMLFALTAGQIAVSAVDLVEIWRLGAVTTQFLAPVAHLLLALVVVAASWVRWSLTSVESKPVESVFDRFFIVLLIDVGLVVIYYIIVRGVEIQVQGGVKTLGPPSASEESLWIMVMFGVYFLWDFAHDVVIDKQNVIIAMFASAFCLAGAWWVWRMTATSTVGSQWLFVLFADLALLGLVLAFRALKGLERPLADRLGLKDHTFKDRPFTWWIWVPVTLVVFFAGVVGMNVV